MHNRTCVQCDEPTPSARHVYCSPRCKWSASNAKRYKRPPRSCPACGDDLTGRHGLVKYCGNACRHWAERHPGVVRTLNDSCAQCGGAMPAGKPAGARYCSKSCKNSACEARRSRDDRARYLSERERRIAYAKQYAKDNPDVGQRAKRKRKALLSAAGAFEVTAKDWRRAKQRTAGRCFYCGEARPLTMDHIIPVSRGGRHSIGNIAPACASCNASKNDRVIMQWRLARLR